MDDTLPKKTEAKPTGRRYASVNELMRDELFSSESQEGFKKLSEETRMTRYLASLRAKAGLSQTELGELIGRTQSAVSKLESNRDEDLSLGDIRDYAKALNERIGILFGPPLDPMEAVKLHALSLKKWLLELANIANRDEAKVREINDFFDEALFNIARILASSLSALPKPEPDYSIQVFDPVSPTNRIAHYAATGSPRH